MRLRIISGELGGRFIKTPDSKFTRPTTDKVKQSLFNWLTNYFDLEGIVAADLYAGSGSLGFELLSRGAAMVHFVEKNYPVQKVLLENIASLKVEDRTKVHKMSAVTFASTTEHTFDIILADPPFFEFDVHAMVKKVSERKLLKEGGIMVIERSIQTTESDTENFGQEPFRRLGDTLLYTFENSLP
ncbi:MAG: 16S rRNA (guanine(966)-N(2))-methyltransferase RsmD [Ignavibacteriales bacterium]|nr:MAG: 16S rRNA (guanine(966)-N(2))-methyltransferase RsmD [Ignavibacteriaceae bacterium]MBW7872515.1 16S rRNA (guanine(966)-N(2))-methyltransferase RsmD [Ignavibacteria bacterium]MCZ2141932.1 16S rRNA (guanine(966)-N(2))-methyltransferase RsmD [Ignavibacteriales bacterium]OQY73694.1 MAG: 16S rRNA (guanine(966)-N(2))-methyltransferase RsmD [Ignavibacteriales bacterium UTCHB3]MBV6445098.1 Ribosomal RNA small subunit methyltransferase D [Ignavibacteriaceae bacterium]